MKGQQKKRYSKAKKAVRSSRLHTEHMNSYLTNADFPERSVDDSIFTAFFIGGVDDEPLSVAVGLRIDTLILIVYDDTI